MLETRAPNCDIVTEKDASFNLGDYVGKKNVVLYFYPKDDTPGCTVEAKDFSSHRKEFESLNTVVVGVSRDSIQSHEKFKSKHNLELNLASDVDGKICVDYDVWVEKSMYGKKYFGIERSTFLIDINGIIKKIWRKVSVPGHVQEVLKEVQNLNERG